MNILPKKNWHVRKKENIARVRRDEAEAAKQEEETRKRAKLAEQEARLEYLRKRSRVNLGEKVSSDDQTAVPVEPRQIEPRIYTEDGNVNFFIDAEKALNDTKVNKEYEAEKKKEVEDYEKRIGLLTYLGQDTFEATGRKHWYNGTENVISKNPDLVNQEEVGVASKLKIDPLFDIVKYTGSKYMLNYKPNCSSSQTTSSSKVSKKLRKKHKHRKHKDNKSKKKRKRKKSKKSEFSYTEDKSDAKRAMLTKLREERLKRESKERIRQNNLLAGRPPDEVLPQPSSSNQKYNSQFNPHLAKQNLEQK